LEQPQWQVTYMPRVAVAPAATGPFRLDPLPCLTNAFEPYIDGKTMEIHHDRHH
jgi:Fe-Mn family superoxide dismutase